MHHMDPGLFYSEPDFEVLDPELYLNHNKNHTHIQKLSNFVIFTIYRYRYLYKINFLKKLLLKKSNFWRLKTFY
jgi:hypothetical protein